MIRLRGYLAGDLEAMYALDVVCFEPVFRFSRRAMRRFAEAAGALVVVAEEEADARLVGFAIVQMERATGYVVTLDVDPAFRGNGLAARMMESLETQALTGGMQAMGLHVFEGNAAAMRLYQRLGYQRAGAAPGFYGRGMDGVVYTKRLGNATETEGI